MTTHHMTTHHMTTLKTERSGARVWRAAASLTIAVASLAGTAPAAAAYPDKPIQVIVPFAAGGGLDANARTFGQALNEILKTPIVVVNKDGAAGSIGLQMLATAPPDGYTLAFTPAVSLTSQLHRLKTIRYGLETFTPVCQVFENIFAIAVPAASPLHNVADLLAKAREKPGEVSYGTSGIGSIPHLGTADIEAAAKVQLSHIPYKGDSGMVQDLMSGRIDFGAVLASSFSAQVQAGSMRLLAVYADKRHPNFPNVPTLTEAGVPVVQLSFGGLLLPAGAPPEVVKTLESACERAAKARAYQEWAGRVGQLIDYQPGSAFQRRLRQDSDTKAAVIKRLGL